MHSMGNAPVDQENKLSDQWLVDIVKTQTTQINSLYLHIPFCFHKCHYCDFYSIVDDHNRQADFTRRLCEEITHVSAIYQQLNRGHLLNIKTIFVGGGTPTLLESQYWQLLLKTLQDSFDLSAVDEFTIEANPETVTEPLAQTLVSGGVNRMSVGAQSFNPDHLKTLERWHDPQNVGKSINILRKAGIDNINLDLIFGIPHQSLEEWETDLNTALDLGIEHLSCYSLMFEPNTPLTKKQELGRIHPIDEDIEAEMYELTIQKLSQAGLTQYEVSNYARPDKACLHNLAYWKNHSWLAFGPSASGHIEGVRYKNAPLLNKYLESKGTAPITEIERLSPNEHVGEALMLRLRLNEGVPLTWIQEHVDPKRQSIIDQLVIDGLLERTSHALKLTPNGLMIADSVLSELI